MNPDTADLLRSTLHSVLTETAGRAAVRRLAELGWHEVAADDPETATRLLFEAQGRALVSTAALDMVVLAALGPFDGVEVVIHPHPDGGQTTAGILSPAGRLAVSGVALGDFDSTAPIVVPVVANGAIACFVAEGCPGPLDARPIDGVAPELGLVHVRGTVDVGAGRLFAAPAWSGAVATARRALAHELGAIAAGMLELAVDHATDRVQFGRPIGKFQAIQHRLADCHVALEAARTATAQAGETGDEITSAAAKALAGNAFRVVAGHCQQVFGAIGFTWEHPFHSRLRRGMVLELLYGSAPDLQRELGQAIRQSDHPFRHLVSL